jgi:hypothetical protein
MKFHRLLGVFHVCCSVDRNIKPFAEFLASLVKGEKQ